MPDEQATGPVECKIEVVMWQDRPYRIGTANMKGWSLSGSGSDQAEVVNLDVKADHVLIEFADQTVTRVPLSQAVLGYVITPKPKEEPAEDPAAQEMSGEVFPDDQ